jgi:hypothetical protein
LCRGGTTGSCASSGNAPGNDDNNKLMRTKIIVVHTNLPVIPTS